MVIIKTKENKNEKILNKNGGKPCGCTHTHTHTHVVLKV